jgi:hypothetical protein
VKKKNLTRISERNVQFRKIPLWRDGIEKER